MPWHSRNQAAGQRGVPPGLPQWETMEPNKWHSSYEHRLCCDSVHRRVFKTRAHRAKMSCRSEGARRPLPAGDSTELNK